MFLYFNDNVSELKRFYIQYTINIRLIVQFYKSIITRRLQIYMLFVTLLLPS